MFGDYACNHAVKSITNDALSLSDCAKCALAHCALCKACTMHRAWNAEASGWSRQQQCLLAHPRSSPRNRLMISGIIVDTCTSRLASVGGGGGQRGYHRNRNLNAHDGE